MWGGSRQRGLGRRWGAGVWGKSRESMREDRGLSEGEEHSMEIE